MSDSIKKVFGILTEVFETTESVLEDYKGDSNMQFPELLNLVADKLSWDKKQKAAFDGSIRMFIRNHDKWAVARGVKGGIMPASVKAERLSNKKTKKSEINEVKKLLEKELNDKLQKAQTSDSNVQKFPLDENDLDEEDESDKEEDLFDEV